MAEMSSGVSQQAAEINVQNLKNILDSYVNLTQVTVKDNQADSRAWDAYKLRIANNAATIDHAINAGLVTGQTENQESVTPIRTGAGDYLAAGAVPANRATDVAAAGVATANQGLADALVNFENVMLQGFAALQAAVVASSGNAAGITKTS